MRVAIDGRTVNWTGIGRYVRNLVKHLMAIASDDDYILLVSADDAAQLRQDPAFIHPRLQLHVVDGSYYSWREHTLLPAQLARVQADVFHFTHFNVPIFFRRPYVVTMHDTTRFIFSGQTKHDWLSQVAYEFVFARSARAAEAVVCVSEATRCDLLRLPLAPARTAVIHEGIDEMFGPGAEPIEDAAVRALLKTDAPYMLYVGVWMEHKNVHRLLEAFAQVRCSSCSLRLVITGQPRANYVDLPALARRAGVADRVIFPGFVPHRLLPALYRGAVGCVFPSLYEGFGLPPLEAAACGTPVVASQVASLPEVLGDAALYVNPDDSQDMAAAIERLADDPGLRQRLAGRAAALAGRFRWQEAARAHWSLYRSVVS